VIINTRLGGGPEPRKQKLTKQPEPEQEVELFNLERGTGLRYPGQWLESIAQRSFINNDDYEDDISNNEDYYEDDGDYF